MKNTIMGQSGSHPAKYSAVTLIAYPVLFVCLTYTLLYIAIMPIIRPYLDFASLFISNEPRQELEYRDLFSESKAASAVSTQGVQHIENVIPFIPIGDVVRPNSGDIYGRLTIEGTKIDAPIYWDDSPSELNAGIGTYAGAWLPGFGRTIMLAGHRNSWLRDLGSAELGGIITVETHYETYTYEIVRIAVYHMNDSTSYDFNREDENIIIYTCYPFDYVGAAKERYFVYGELRSGIQVEQTR